MTISNDDVAEALHLLSVVRAAQALVVCLARSETELPISSRTLIDEVSRLAVFQKQATRRGLPAAQDAEKVAEAIRSLRAGGLLNREQQEAREITPDAAAELFSGNGLAAAPDDAFKI
jgi:hypothetical protein